jgi:hypothetical protein
MALGLRDHLDDLAPSGNKSLSHAFSERLPITIQRR